MSTPQRLKRSYAIPPNAPSKSSKPAHFTDNDETFPNKQLFKPEPQPEPSHSTSSNQTLEGCWYCWGAMGNGPACLTHK